MGLSQFSYPDTLISYWKGGLGSSGTYLKNEVPGGQELFRIGNPSGTYFASITGDISNQWLLTNCSGNSPNRNYLFTSSGYVFPQSGRIDFLFRYNGYNASSTQEERMVTIGDGTGYLAAALIANLGGFYRLKTNANGQISQANGSALLSGTHSKISFTWNLNDTLNNTNRYKMYSNNSQIVSISGFNFANPGLIRLGNANNGADSQLTQSYLGPVALSSDVNFDTKILGWPL